MSDRRGMSDAIQARQGFGGPRDCTVDCDDRDDGRCVRPRHAEHVRAPVAAPEGHAALLCGWGSGERRRMSASRVAADQRRAVLLVVDADDQARAATEEALRARFGADYDVVAVPSGSTALT